MTRLVQIFDRPCCNPSAAAQLAEFLQDRVTPDVTVEYHDLNVRGTQPITVPTTLVSHLTGGGALPVMTIDGALVASGVMPNLMEALDLAAGASARAPSRTLKVTASGNSSCC